MIRWLKKPISSEVSKYVECFWFLEKTEVNLGIDSPKLNPDPCAHIIISLPKQPYCYKSHNNHFQGYGNHWLYPFSNTLELDHAHAFSCIGIKFHVGALYSLKIIDFTQAKINTVTEMIFNEIKGNNTYNEQDLLTMAQTKPLICCETIERLIMPWFEQPFEDTHSKLTRKVMPLLPNHTINALGDILQCSQRTLERSFLKVTGLTLKQCQSMNKLEDILTYLYQRKTCDINWVDVAYQFGFSDQPHLIRYLKKQINLTPKNYAVKRELTIDVYGGIDLTKR